MRRTNQLISSAARSCRWFAALSAVLALLSRLPFAAQTSAASDGQPLACGTPVQAHLETGATDTYQVTIAPGSAVLVEARDTSGTIGLLKLSAPEGGPDGETCSGALELTDPAESEIDVSDCLGTDSGDYTVTATVVSQSSDNCGLPLSCGVTPQGMGIEIPEQVRSYVFDGGQGDVVTITSRDIAGTIRGIRLRVFDPDGAAVNGGDSCAGTVNLQLPKAGTYTVLVSSCDATATTGLYKVDFAGPTCPLGPEITFLGLALADGTPVLPDFFDDTGVPYYVRAVGAGFVIVIEAGPGLDGTSVGRSGFNYDASDPTVLPDLQVLLSRSIGNGSPTVCDKTLPHAGGVPAAIPFDFETTEEISDAINDFGCRTNDGTGIPQGVSSIDACTLFPDGEFHFVDPTSSLQFCALINSFTTFPTGDTALKVRVRDTRGVVGAPREMVIRIPAACLGDCNGDGVVTVDELINGVDNALGIPSSCLTRYDRNHDGMVTVDELLQAVDYALNGCPAGTSA
jgi:hypothetical protein